MNARQQIINAQKRELQNAGYDLASRPGIRFNHGSETAAHFLSKALTGWLLHTHGYVVDSEIEMDGYVCDLIAYGLEDRRPVLVEIETESQDGIWELKWDKLGSGEIRELYVLDPIDLSDPLAKQGQEYRSELGCSGTSGPFVG